MLKLYSIFVPELKAQLATGDYPLLKKILNELSPIELAAGWEEFTDKEKVLLFRLLSATRGLQLFEEIETKDQEFILSEALGERFDHWAGGIEPETKLNYFSPHGERFTKSLHAQARKQRLPIFTPQQGDWPLNSAGALMKREYFCVEAAWKANQTLERLQTTARLKNVGELYALYVTDKDGRLLGILSLKVLIAAPADIKIADIMWPVGLLKVRPEIDQEDVARMFTKYNLMSLPVVNEHNKLLGSIIIDDVLDVIKEEATEDIAKMAGTKAAELTHKRIRDVIALRMPWLIITCFGELMVSNIIKHFEGTLSQVIALASFMPIIAAMGGNIGTQSSTIGIRAIALGDWQITDFKRAIVREFFVGLCLGLIYGSLASLLAFLLYGDRFGILFPLMVGAGLTMSMSIAATMGAAEPFIFHKLGIDPATAAGPLVTTLTDMISVSSYLLVATWFLSLGILGPAGPARP